MLKPRVKRVGKQAKRAVKRPDDPENVHQTRVATRRLRTVFRGFKRVLPPESRMWNKEMRSVTKTLGDARDLDVQILFLDSLIHDQRKVAVRDGLMLLREEREHNRAKAQKRVDKAIASLKATSVLNDMEKWCKAHAQDLPDPPSRTLKLFAFEQIGLALDEVYAFEKSLPDPKKVGEHHALRIAIKHFRYSLELFGPLFRDGLTAWIEKAKYAQDSLGILHDLDVWIEKLPGELLKTLSRDGQSDIELPRPAEQGTKWLLTYCRTQRRDTHAQFVVWWKDNADEQHRRGLRRTLGDSIVENRTSNS